MRRSVETEPSYAGAHAYLALVLAMGQRTGLLSDERWAVSEAGQAAEKALELDDLDSTVLGHAGCALAEIGETRRGVPMMERALEQDPSNAQAWAALGAAKLTIGRVDEAIDDLRGGMALSPLDNRLAVWGSALAFSLTIAGRLEDAVAEAETACRRDFRNHIPWVTRAAVLLAAEQAGDARHALDEAFKVRPDLSEDMINRLIGHRWLETMRDHGLR